jgi:hypothetical protein
VQHGTRPAAPQESNQLQLLEQLLWTGRRKPAKRHSFVHRAILTHLLQRVSLELTSSTILYVQQGEPGPWKPASPTDPMDGLRLTMRTMRLAPAYAAPGAASAPVQVCLQGSVAAPPLTGSWA